jgi:FtsH-binding integral membrane protein
MATTLTNRANLGIVTTINQSFGWMFVGLLVTTLSSLLITSSQTLTNAIINNNFIYFGLIIAELIVVFVLSAKIQSMTFSEAIMAFLLYAFLNGLTLSSIFIVYTATSIATTFLVTTIVFGIMAVYGYTTKRDLTSIGNLAVMALIGVIVASLVNLFLHNTLFSYILSYLSIVIFIGLTAYDTQKIKEMESYSDNKNLGILGALTLYLDFINIFLNLLRILGRQRED